MKTRMAKLEMEILEASTKCPNRRDRSGKDSEELGANEKPFRTELFAALEAVHDSVEQNGSKLTGKQRETLIFALQSVLLGNSKGVENFLRSLRTQGEQANLMLKMFAQALAPFEIHVSVSFPSALAPNDMKRFDRFMADLVFPSVTRSVDEIVDHEGKKSSPKVAFYVGIDGDGAQPTSKQKDSLLEQLAFDCFQQASNSIH
jgi:hypothetical protein